MKKANSFSSRIEDEMNRLGISAAELAKRADVDRTTIYRILKNKNSSVSIDTVKKIAKALKAEPAIFLCAVAES